MKNNLLRTAEEKSKDKELRQLRQRQPTPSRSLVPGKHRKEFDWFFRIKNWKLHTRRQSAKKKAARKNANHARKVTLVYRRKRD
jgi:hypothetical protein